MKEEAALIEAIKTGNAAAFEQLVLKYQALVFTMAYRKVNNREDAEEIAQDVFVRAFKYIHNFKGDSKFSTWLCAIAHNSSSTFLNKRTITFDLLEEGRHDKTDSTDEKPSDEKLKQVEFAIRQLAEEDAQIITLFYRGEQSLAEIAAVMNMAENAAKVKLHRARIKIRALLTKP